MPQDITKVLLGHTPSSYKKGIESFGATDPALVPAGTFVRLKRSGKVAETKPYDSPDEAYNPELYGVSMGRDLSDASRVSVIKAGIEVPVLLTNAGTLAFLVVQDITYTSVIAGLDGENTSIRYLADVDEGDEAFEIMDPEGAPGDITVHIQSGASTATEVMAAFATAPAEVLALITAQITGTAGDAQVAAGFNGLGGSVEPYAYVVPGQLVWVDDVTGKATEETEAVTSVSKAVYSSGVLTGVNEDGAEVPIALVDFVGGV